MKRIVVVALLAGVQLIGSDERPNKISITQYDNVLPQIADGKGWSTRIMLVNMGGAAASFTLYFYDKAGAPWSIELKDRGIVTSLTETIPIGGTLFLETVGTAAEVSQGWAYLSTEYWISGMAVFKAAWLPTNDAEAVVPFSSEVDVNFFIPFDNRNGYVTSVALVNPYRQLSASVAVQFRNPDGTVIRNDTIPLAPGQHLAFETTTRYPETDGKNGVIEFLELSGNVAAAGLGLLFSPRNTFTSMHSVSIDPNYF